MDNSDIETLRQDFITDMRVTCRGLPEDSWLGLMSAAEDGVADATFAGAESLQTPIDRFKVVARFSPGEVIYADLAKICAGVESRCHFWLDQRGFTGEKRTDFHRGAAIQPAMYNHLWCDIDPPKGRLYDVNSWYSETLARLREWAPCPTMIVSTGRGFKVVWSLDKLTDDWEIIGKKNRWLAQQWSDDGGDHCWSAAHILRIAGTWNPKADAQRFARIVWIDESLVYSLDTFGTAEVDIGLTYPEYISTTPLPTNIEERIRNSFDQKFLDLVKTGKGRETLLKKKKGGTADLSQSGVDAYVVAKLLRAAWPKELIKGIMMHDEWASGEKYRRTLNEYYVDRTINKMYAHIIETAKEHDNWIETINKDYFKAMLGGTAVVVKFIENVGRIKNVFTPMTHENFAKCFRDVLVSPNGGETVQPLGTYWLDSPLARKYDEVIFDPSYSQVSLRDYNLWRGYSVEPSLSGAWDKFKRHIFENLCGSSEELFEFILDWMAFCVGKMDLLPEVAIVLRGDEGIGKTFFAKQLGRLFGEHYIEITQPSQIVGNFNAHFEKALLVLVDEAVWAGDKRGEGVLKAYITQEDLYIERKGIDRYKRKSHLRFVFSSNSSWVVPVGLNGRRYVVLECGAGARLNSEYFAGIEQELVDGGYSRMLWDLLERSRGLPNRPMCAIMTLGTHRQKINTESALALWTESLREKTIAGYYEWDDYIPWAAEYEHYRRTFGSGAERRSRIEFNSRMAAVRGDVRRKTTYINKNTKKRENGWKFLPWEDCVADYVQRYGVSPFDLE